jgi:DNA-binding LytR/AlgR family response regulator
MILSWLKKPYPFANDIRHILAGNLIIGAFIALFLIVFQPFNINLWITDNKIIKLIGFGFVSFLAPTLFALLLRVLLSDKMREQNWSIGSELISIMIVLMLVALGNLAYSWMLGITAFSLSEYASALIITCIIGVFPVSIHVARKHNRLMKLHLEQALQLSKELEQKKQVQEKDETRADKLQEEKKNEAKEEKREADEWIILTAENGKDQLKIKSEELLFIESADNYSNIISFSNNNRKREMIRSSLKRIEGQIPLPHIIRCHRAYIINLKKIRNIEGNAAGYKVSFHDHSDTVPVSRNYIPAFNEKLKELGLTA